MRRTIKELEDKYQDAEREVSVFDGKSFSAYAEVFLPRILRFLVRLGQVD